MSDKLLLSEAPASVFQPRLAAWIGLNESILLQHVHYLVSKPDFGVTVDGVKWIRMTTEEWAEELPCFDPHTIRRTLDNLENDGLIISRTFSGRSKWYRVNYELLTTIEGPVDRLQSRTKARAKANEKAKEAKHNVSVQNGHIGDVCVQNGQLYVSKMDSPSVQNGQLPRPLSKTSSDTLLPKGNSGSEPQQPNLSLDDSEQSEEPRETLEPDTPETQLMFEKINHNRKLKGWGPVKRFKSYEQKQRCLEAVARLDHVMFTASLSKGLEKGLTDLTSLVNWIAAWKTKERKKVKGGQKQPTSELNPANPDDWDQMLKSVA